MPFILMQPLTHAQKKPIDIIFEDEHLLVLNKPSGLLSVPGKIEPFCLTAQALAYNPNSRVVHRLDMSTSGLIIFAKSHASQKAMGQRFEQRQVSKYYQAIIHGVPKAPSGTIEKPLICDWPNRPKQKICFEQGKPATTHYEVIEELPHVNACMVTLKPITGRSHQLRVHCLALGCPILGDQLYHQENSHLKAPRLMLHAAELAFDHPITQLPMQIKKDAQFDAITLKL